MESLGGAAVQGIPNMPQQEQGPKDVRLQLTAFVDQDSNSRSPGSTANDHAIQRTEPGPGLVTWEAHASATKVLHTAGQQGHVDASSGAQATDDADTTEGAPAAAAIHSKQALILPQGMDGASSLQLYCSTITEQRSSVLDCPLTFTDKLLHDLDSTSMLAMFQTCVWLRDTVLNQARITEIIVRSLKTQSLKETLQALQLASKHGSRVKLTFNLSEEAAVGRIVPKLSTAGSTVISVDACGCTTYTDVLAKAGQMGVLDCITMLELAGVDLSTLLPACSDNTHSAWVDGHPCTQTMMCPTCPNLTSLKLQDSTVRIGGAHDSGYRTAFPKLQSLSFREVTLQDFKTGCMQKLQQQLGQLTALTSLSFQTSGLSLETYASPRIDGMIELYTNIMCAMKPTVASQLTSLGLICDEHYCPFIYIAWDRAGLAPHLTAIQVLEINTIVNDSVMQQLLDLPSLRHVTAFQFAGQTRCFAGHKCQWQTVQCYQIAIRDLAWLPLHADMVIKSPPGEIMQLDMWCNPATAATMIQALANIQASGWRGWHNNQEVQVILEDEESEATMVQALPLLAGISHLRISDKTDQLGLSSNSLLALRSFAARQPQGFYLEIDASWDTIDMWPLLASMPTGSQLAVHNVDETTFRMLCLFSTTSMTLHARNSISSKAGFSARLESSLAHFNRQAATVTARRVPGKRGCKQSWQWEVTMQGPSDGTQQFLTAQRCIMQQMMAQTGATEASGSAAQAVASTAVVDQQTATTLSGMDAGAVVKKVCQPIRGAEVLPLVDCPDSSLLQVLHTPDPAFGLAILQTCPPSNDRVLRQADSIMIRSDLLDPAANQQALKALERASKHSNNVHLTLNMLQQTRPATDEVHLLPDAVAGGEGNPVQLHAEEANFVQGSDGDTVSRAGQQQLQINRRWASLLKGAHSMGAFQCITRLELVGAELNAPLPAAVGLACPNVTVFRLQDSIIRFDKAAEEDFSVALPKLQALHLYDVQCRGGSGQGWAGQLRQLLTQLTALTSMTLTKRVHDPDCEVLYSNVVHAVVPAATEHLTHLKLWWYQYLPQGPEIVWRKSGLSQHLASVCSLSVAMTVSDGVMQQLLNLPLLRHLEVYSFSDLMHSFAGHTCHWRTVRCSETGVKDLAWLPLHADMVIQARAGFALNLRLDSDVPVEQALANIKQSGWAGWQATQVQLQVRLHNTATQHLMMQSLPLWAGVAHLNITEGLLSNSALRKMGSCVASQAQGIHVELPADPKWMSSDISSLASSMPGGSRLTVHGIDEVSFIHLCMSAQSSITICAKNNSPGRVGFLECVKSTMALCGQQIAETSILQVHPRVVEGASWEWLVKVHEPRKKTELHILELYGEILEACMSASAASSHAGAVGGV